MLPRGRSLFTIFVASALIEFVVQTLTANTFNITKLIFGSNYLAQVINAGPIIMLINFAINPVLLFIFMYHKGRSVAIAKDYKRIALYLFVAGVVGGSIGYWLTPGIFGGQYGGPGFQGDLLSLVVFSFEIQLGLATLFPGFTGIALGFLKELKVKRPGVLDSIENGNGR